VCEVEYTDWSHDRTLRTPVFIRRREDKTPAECTVDEEERRSRF
jgi:ATP-dependent DNA ligase